MSVTDFYFNAKNELLKSEYINEINFYRNIKFEDIDAIDFFHEYVWVVLNSGFREQAARKVFDNFMSTIDVSVIKHPGKHKAIVTGLSNFVRWHNELKSDAVIDKIEYLVELPYIGPITKFHLARNLGIDCVKPDVHLTRLAKLYNFDNPLNMCLEIQKHDHERIGIIDIILWRFCNLHGSKNINTYLDAFI